MADADKIAPQDASIEDVLSSIKQIVEQEAGTAKPAAPTADPAPELTSNNTTAVLTLSPQDIIAEGGQTATVEPEMIDLNAFAQTGEVKPVSSASPVAAAPEMTTAAAAKTPVSQPVPEGQVRLTALAGPQGLQVAFPVEVLAEALRPLVKDWVENHLPDIVERLVREELAKLAKR